MADKIPTEKQNGVHSPELSSTHGGGRYVDTQAEAAVPNGLCPGVLVVCPEMCCYCFDVLIAHLTNNHHSSRNPFLKCFKNDE